MHATLRDWIDDRVIGVLAARERHGLEVVDAVLARWPESREPDERLAEGSVYAALRRLEHRGLLVGTWVVIGGNIPRRRFYALSPKGKRVAETARARRPVAPGVGTLAQARP